MIKNQLISVVKILNFWRKLFEIMSRSLWLTSWFFSLGWSLISANSRQKKMSFTTLYFSARNAPECRKMHLNSQIFRGSVPSYPTSLLPRFAHSIPCFAQSLWATKDDFGPLKKIGDGYWQPVVNSEIAIDNRLSIAIDNRYSLAVI